MERSSRRLRRLGFRDNPEYVYGFVLAERLGMTLEELGERMSSKEFSEWAIRDDALARRQKEEEETRELEARSKAGLKR